MLGLFLAAHLAMRRLAPGADGTLLPLAALLNGIGYVFIARLDERSRPRLQATWTAVGIGAFVAHARRRAPRARPQALPLHVRADRLVLLLLCRSSPASGATINGASIWVSLGPLSFQPGEFAKIALALFFAAYLVEKRELLAHERRGGSGRSICPTQAPRPGARGVGRLAS